MNLQLRFRKYPHVLYIYTDIYTNTWYVKSLSQIRSQSNIPALWDQKISHPMVVLKDY